MKNTLKIFRGFVGSILILLLTFSPLASTIKVEDCDMECHTDDQMTRMISSCCALDAGTRGEFLSLTECKQEMKHNFDLTEIEHPKNVTQMKDNKQFQYFMSSSPVIHDDISSEIYIASISNSHTNSAPLFLLNSAFLS